MRLRLTVLLLLVLGASASVPLRSQSAAPPAGPGLAERARDVERRLALVAGHESAKATVRFPFQGTIPATQRGRGYDPTADLARSETVLKALEAGTDPLWRAKGDTKRHHFFAPADEILPYRVAVPSDWDGKQSLPIVLMLHGGGSNEDAYMDLSNRLLPRLADQHHYIVVSPLGYRSTGAYGNPLRLPAVFGQPAAAVTQRAAVTPERARELTLSELEVMSVLEIVTAEYGADRSRTFLAGHSMGSGGAWHLAARYPDRWRAVAPMSGPFVDEPTYSFDRIRRLPILMTEGTGATPSLEGSRLFAAYLKTHNFNVEYLEVDGDHMGMVPMVLERVFQFFSRQ